MSSNHLPQLETGEHPPLELLRQYHSGTLPEHLHHQLERHLLSCPLCSDLVDGLEVLPPPRIRKAVKETRGRLKDLIAAKKRKKRLFLLPVWQTVTVLLVVLLCIGFAFYQQYQLQQKSRSSTQQPTSSLARELTGKVVSSSGESVAGATIQLKGQNSQALSDREGNFRIEIPLNGAKFIISHPDFQTVEIATDSVSSPLMITLQGK
ncbi:MAG: carboxypeptidase regulatory-like domain-containing protein [Rufibacter sp.]